MMMIMMMMMMMMMMNMITASSDCLITDSVSHNGIDLLTRVFFYIIMVSSLCL